jgi:DNA-binding NarL/FixJ family response regulator
MVFTIFTLNQTTLKINVMKILIVDDQELVVLFLKSACWIWVTVSATIIDGIQKYDLHSPDLVIADIGAFSNDPDQTSNLDESQNTYNG